MSDKLLAGSSFATTSVLTLHNRIYVNPLVAATFSTNSTGVVVTRGTGNAYIDVVTTVTPTNGALTLDSADVQKYVSNITNSEERGVVQ